MPTADELLSPAAVAQLRRTLKAVTGSALPSVRRVALAELGLGDRVRAVRDALLADLGGSAGPLFGIFRTALRDPRFAGWLIWPVSEAVAAVAVASDAPADFEDGLALLAEMTSRLTGEFAIRTFLNADLDRTLAVVRTWTDEDDESVRRLASEGTRPRLPWAKRVPALFTDPSVTIGILDALHRDESETVRRSVANHLNDISRIDPELAVRTATRWSTHADPSTAQLVRHSMRTLIKQGDRGAMALMGFPPVESLVVSGFALDAAKVAIGGDLGFRFTVRHDGPAPTRLAIDYVIHYVKASGATAGKVFKLSVKNLDGGQNLALAKRHSFRPISTRVHYPGVHRVELQINGESYGSQEFVVTPGA